MITDLELPLKASFNLTGFYIGEVYRFRFLNNNFDDGNLSMITISFSYANCLDPIKDRENFTIIGADSSLFHTGIYNQTSFVITQAERMEILIKFQRASSFSICANNWETQMSDIGIASKTKKVKEEVLNIVNDGPSQHRKHRKNGYQPK
jgi:FtsP/CotA-like multicopper oxidase with cupredoxin domain